MLLHGMQGTDRNRFERGILPVHQYRYLPELELELEVLNSLVLNLFCYLFQSNLSCCRVIKCFSITLPEFASMLNMRHIGLEPET